jgi:hypothetical protein
VWNGTLQKDIFKKAWGQVGGMLRSIVLEENGNRK